MFHLTRQERLVLIFLAVVFWVGITVQYLCKLNPRLQEMLDLVETDWIKK